MYKFKGCRIEEITEINVSGSGRPENDVYLLTFSWCDVEYVPDSTKTFDGLENPKDVLVNNFNKHSYKFTV